MCDADYLGLSDSVCGADELIAEPHSDAGLAVNQPPSCSVFTTFMCQWHFTLAPATAN